MSIALDACVAAGLTTVAAHGYAEADLTTAEQLDGPTAWLFGNEAHGLPEDVLARAEHAVRVPLYGKAESLNLATAAAVCLYTTAVRHRS